MKEAIKAVFMAVQFSIFIACWFVSWKATPVNEIIMMIALSFSTVSLYYMVHNFNKNED